LQFSTPSRFPTADPCQDSAWQVALSGTNLTNRQYFVFKEDLRQIYAILIGQPGPPLQWAVSVKRNFL
jgi:hypothetical protein